MGTYIRSIILLALISSFSHAQDRNIIVDAFVFVEDETDPVFDRIFAGAGFRVEFDRELNQRVSGFGNGSAHIFRSELGEVLTPDTLPQILEEAGLEPLGGHFDLDDIPLGQSYFGYSLRADVPELQLPSPDNERFYERIGWLQFERDDDEFQVLRSFVNEGTGFTRISTGVVVGGGIVVPEPSSSLMIPSGLVALLALRRRRGIG